MILATASEEIRLWNFSRGDDSDGETSLQLTQHFNPHHEQIAKIVWSPDNSLLGSSSKSGKALHLTSLSDELSSVKLEPNDPPETCLAFNSSGRFLLTGSLNGQVAIYDIKKASLKRSYVPLSSGAAGKTSTTCVTFTPDNFCSVSGHQGGEIVFINIRSGQVFSPLYLSGPGVTTVAGNGGTVQALRFGRFSRSVLASAHASGTVALWNAGLRALSSVMDVHHRGPCMDLSFSPVNEMLLVSAGLDRTVRCYDVLQARHVRCVEADLPLLCVAVANDGYTLAAGTSNGRVLLFDLRAAGRPFASRSAHSGPVSAARFEATEAEAPSGRASLDSLRSSASIRRPLVEATNVEPLSRTVEGSGDCKAATENESFTGSLILPPSSFSANLGDSCDNLNASDSARQQKSVHFDDSFTDPRPPHAGDTERLSRPPHAADKPLHNSFTDPRPPHAADKPLHDSFTERLLDLPSALDSSPDTALDDSSPGVPPRAAPDLGEVAKMAEELRGDMARMRLDLDQRLFEWYGKLVWQLCVTENRIISHVNKLLDDRSAMGEELDRLRKENERLKKTF